MKRKISITLEEETVLDILKSKNSTKSSFVEQAIEGFLKKLEGDNEA